MTQSTKTDKQRGIPRDHAVVQARTRVLGRSRGDIVLARRGDEYVTACHTEGDAEWHSGHYFRSEGAARADFAARVRRGY